MSKGELNSTLLTDLKFSIEVKEMCIEDSVNLKGNNERTELVIPGCVIERRWGNEL